MSNPRVLSEADLAETERYYTGGGIGFVVPPLIANLLAAVRALRACIADLEAVQQADRTRLEGKVERLREALRNIKRDPGPTSGINYCGNAGRDAAIDRVLEETK